MKLDSWKAIIAYEFEYFCELIRGYSLDIEKILRINCIVLVYFFYFLEFFFLNFSLFKLFNIDVIQLIDMDQSLPVISICGV